ncbi:lipopolysaccharide assembly protein LapB [Phenylobacterium sp. CCH9-H3]|uniref:tetratricopeptide repeat protein n=1 Tax=Phenylobacterium sp. CCH9-H3 TaxID=1768774 RepID=UPI00083B1F7A|nr:tetratricopeptide repeat protein [Phenylobacterium sp. CCH9-H3]
MPKRPPPSPQRPNVVNPALEHAVISLQAQRPDDAQRLASVVLKADRGNVMAAQILAEAFLLQDRVQEAIDLLQRTVRRSQEPGTETLLAMALNAAGRGDEALEQLRRATMRRPVFPLAFLKLGEQLAEIGRFDEAIAVLEGGLALVPDGVGLRVGLGFIHLGRNQRDVARRLFLQVLATSPDRHDATVGLARVMAADGEYADAADLLRRALALRPEDVATLVELGKCQLELGARGAGEATLRAAVRRAHRLAPLAIVALATTSHGRFFLRPSEAAAFLGGAAS